MIYSKTLCKVDQELCADNDEIPGYSGTFPHLWDKERDTFAHFWSIARALRSFSSSRISSN